MKTAIIYHKVDLDGVASAAIARMYYADKDNREIKYIPYDYGDNIDDILSEVKNCTEICVLDASFGDKTYNIFKKWMEENRTLVWIDHHKGILNDAIEWDIHPFGIRKVGEAACELAYKYFLLGLVPKTIQYLSAYDVWDKERFRWDDTMAIQYAMRAKVGLSVDKMYYYLQEQDDFSSFDNLIAKGKTILNYIGVKNEGEVKNYSFVGEIDGIKAICMNTLEFNSTTFKSLTPDHLSTENIKLMMPFAIQPNGLVRFSLYTQDEDVDCCEIAKRFGGGGHKGASGFQLPVNDERVTKFFSEHIVNSTKEEQS